jgi:hypothetical protein
MIRKTWFLHEMIRKGKIIETTNEWNSMPEHKQIDKSFMFA